MEKKDVETERSGLGRDHYWLDKLGTGKAQQVAQWAACYQSEALIHQPH